MQETIKIIIVEDEEIWQQSLIRMAEKLGFEIVGIAATSDAALPLISKNNYDIALLDIRIKGNNNGVEIGKMINTIYNKPLFLLLAVRSRIRYKKLLLQSQLPIC